MNNLEKGIAWHKENKHELAVEVLTSFLSREPYHADALYYRAISYRKTGNLGASIEDFSNILKRLPNEASILCERGISYFHKKEIDKALKDMDKAVEMDPSNPYRYSSRAYIRTQTNIEGAIQDYEKAIELDPNDAVALNNLGLLEENRGKIYAAKKHFDTSNKIIGYQPNSGEKSPAKKIPASLPQIVGSIFTSSTARKEYFQFLRTFFKKT